MREKHAAPAPVVLHQHGRLCTACFTNAGNIPLLQRFPCSFFHLCAPAHGQNHRLIFQNMFRACTPLSPPLLSMPPSFAPVILLPPTSSLSHTAHSLFTTYTPLYFPHTSPPPNLPACLLAQMCDIFPYLMFCCSSAPFKPITSVVCFMD